MIRCTFGHAASVVRSRRGGVYLKSNNFLRQQIYFTIVLLNKKKLSKIQNILYNREVELLN